MIAALSVLAAVAVVGLVRLRRRGKGCPECGRIGTECDDCWSARQW